MTPALLLDLQVARRNIERMQSELDALGTKLRPHVKAHKCVALARMQVGAGAIGVTCATVWEAAVMARGGIDDVLIANQVVGEDKVRALADLARAHRITVAVDDAQNAEQLSRTGAELGVVVEVDVGMGRGGVRSADDARRLADRVADLPGLTLRGVTGYEGHVMVEPDMSSRERAARKAVDRLVEAARRLDEPPELVSAGGTGTYAVTGGCGRVTEVQAGSYVLMDEFHEQLVPGRFEVALTVLGTVVSRHGSTVVLDAGRKSVSTDFATPRLVQHPQAVVRTVAEEHCVVDFPGTPPLSRGDTAELTVAYAPTAVNLHDVFHVLEDDVVCDLWAIEPRGSGPNR